MSSPTPQPAAEPTVTVPRQLLQLAMEELAGWVASHGFDSSTVERLRAALAAPPEPCPTCSCAPCQCHAIYYQEIKQHLTPLEARQLGDIQEALQREDYSAAAEVARRFGHTALAAPPPAEGEEAELTLERAREILGLGTFYYAMECPDGIDHAEKRATYWSEGYDANLERAAAWRALARHMREREVKEKSPFESATEAARNAWDVSPSPPETAAHWDCPECGSEVEIDEDGCCAGCGADAQEVISSPPETAADLEKPEPIPSSDQLAAENQRLHEILGHTVHRLHQLIDVLEPYRTARVRGRPARLICPDCNGRMPAVGECETCQTTGRVSVEIGPEMQP